jgi:hypothetical protein
MKTSRLLFGLIAPLTMLTPGSGKAHAKAAAEKRSMIPYERRSDV